MDAVVDLQLLGSTRENLVGRLGARRERRELRSIGLRREAPLREENRARRPGFSSVDAMRRSSP